MERKPIPIQLCRTKGWRMPPNTKKVDRTTPWGNPHRVTPPDPNATPIQAQMDAWHLCTTPQAAVAKFRREVEHNPRLRARIRRELRGFNLACWCRLGSPCHRDVLLEVANSKS